VSIARPAVALLYTRYPREVRRRGLREEQGRAQVAAQKIVPRGRGDLAHGCRIEGGGIVDEHIEAPELRDGGGDELLRRRLLVEVGGEQRGRIRAGGVQLLAEHSRRRGGGSVVHEDASAGRMQRTRNLCADAPRRAGDENHPTVERAPGDVVGRHARSRYRIARGACIAARGVGR
jgi:hypothetical protein